MDIRIPEGEETEKQQLQKKIEDNITENFPKLVIDTKPKRQEAQKIATEMNTNTYTNPWTSLTQTSPNQWQKERDTLHTMGQR